MFEVRRAKGDCLLGAWRWERERLSPQQNLRVKEKDPKTLLKKNKKPGVVETR